MLTSRKTPRYRVAFTLVMTLLLAMILSACGDATNTASTGAGGTTAASGAATTAAGGAAATAAPTPLPGIANAPAVPAADIATAKPYSGQSIVYYGDTVPPGSDFDNALAAQFTKDTGINVKVVPKPNSSTDAYAQYQRLFQGKSDQMDVMMLDVVWPSSFAPDLADLGPKLGDQSKTVFPSAVQNDTVNGKLIAMPWFGDFGMLYYRTDLLQKYGYTAPPTSWDDLEAMAKKIQDGEKASNPNFTGYVWQGQSYEGLTCDAMEWLSSQGGGSILDDKGQVSLNNPQAIKALSRAKGWVGTISPSGVTSYDEEGARNVWNAGNAAFMRNWPYAYSLSQAADSKVSGKFDVAPLPHDAGQQSAGTLGGWQLGVSAFSKHQDAAIEFVRYMTSPEVVKYRAVVGSYVPTIQSVSADPDVLKAQPYLSKMASVVRVTRPSNAAGINYNEVSTKFFQGVTLILQGQDPTATVKQMSSDITNLLK